MTGKVALFFSQSFTKMLSQAASRLFDLISRLVPYGMGTLRSDDATATRTSKTTIDLVGKTTTLQVHLTFLYISLPFLHDCDVKLPNFTFSGGRKQATTKFYSLSKLEYGS